MLQIPGQTMARKYPSMVAFQREAAQLAPLGWYPISVQEHAGMGALGAAAMVVIGLLLTPACIGVFILLSIPNAMRPKAVNAIFEQRPIAHLAPQLQGPRTVPLPRDPSGALSGTSGEIADPATGWGTWQGASAPLMAASYQQAPLPAPSWQTLVPSAPVPLAVPRPPSTLTRLGSRLAATARRVDTAIARYLPNGVLRWVVYIVAAIVVLGLLAILI